MEHLEQFGTGKMEVLMRTRNGFNLASSSHTNALPNDSMEVEQQSTINVIDAKRNGSLESGVETRKTADDEREVGHAAPLANNIIDLISNDVNCDFDSDVNESNPAYLEQLAGAYNNATFQDILLSVVTKPPENVDDVIKQLLHGSAAGTIKEAITMTMDTNWTGWVNDVIVNEFQDLMRARQRALNNNLQNHNQFYKCYFAHSFLKDRLTKTAEGSNHSTLHRQRKIFDMDRAFFPMHINNNHWALVLADIQKKKIFWIDSFNSHRLNECTRLIKKYLEAISKEKNLEFNSKEWKTKSLKVHQQSDEFNCGVYILLYEVMLSMDYWPEDFQPIQLLEFRKKIATSILAGSFLNK